MTKQTDIEYTCQQCKKKFTGRKIYNRKYCTIQCSGKYRNLKRRRKYISYGIKCNITEAKSQAIINIINSSVT